MSVFTVNLVGGFEAQRDGQTLDLPPSCQRLIALLALTGRPVHRSWVCSTLFGDTLPRNAGARLRSTLWRLRPFGAELMVSADARFVALAPDVEVDWRRVVSLCDRVLVGTGQTAAQDAELLAELLPLLRAGELLDGWFDDWSAHERNRYRVLRLSSLDALALKLSDSGRYVDAQRVKDLLDAGDPVLDACTSAGYARAAVACLAASATARFMPAAARQSAASSSAAPSPAVNARACASASVPTAQSISFASRPILSTALVYRSGRRHAERTERLPADRHVQRPVRPRALRRLLRYGPVRPPTATVDRISRSFGRSEIVTH